MYKTADFVAYMGDKMLAIAKAKKEEEARLTSELDRALTVGFDGNSTGAVTATVTEIDGSIAETAQNNATGESIELRAMVEMLGGTIEWNSNTRTSTVVIGNMTGSFAAITGAERSSGSIAPWINDRGIMIVSEADFYAQMGVIALEWAHVFDRGRVIFAMTDGNDGTLNNLSSVSIGERDILMRDLRHAINPAIEIMNAYRISNLFHRGKMLEAIADFENRNPSEWNRHTDIASMRQEWWLHIVAYENLPDPWRRQGRNAHIDNQMHGATPWSFLPFIP
jgi:hypothetical protein